MLKNVRKQEKYSINHDEEGRTANYSLNLVWLALYCKTFQVATVHEPLCDVKETNTSEMEYFLDLRKIVKLFGSK